MTKKHYDKLSHREHILKRYDMYIGSIKLTSQSKFIFNNEKIVKNDIEISSGLERIYLEVILNAADNVLNSREAGIKVGKIIVNVDRKKIEIYNEGLHISTSISKKHKIRIPELIFFNLMSGSNFDDNNMRKTGGKFGMGSKLTSIFSKKFIVEIGDPKHHIYYKQFSENNMDVISQAEMSQYDNTKGFTKITFYPDFERFYIKELSDDMINLFHYYALSVSFTKNVKIIFNGIKHKLDIFDFAKLFEFYDGERNNLKIETGDSEVLFVDAPETGDMVSFVNSTPTLDGVHTKEWLNSTIKELGFDLRSTKSQFKRNIFMIVNCLLVEPDFTSQSKTTLSNPKPTVNFKGCKIKQMMKWDAIKYIKDADKAKLYRATDGKKTKYVNNKKLSDAKLAGTKDSSKCILYLTEGDSAKGSALRCLPNREYYGIFPLKGKPINSSKSDDNKYINNKEVVAIKKILGIKEELDYSDPINIKKLRYGKVGLFCDQDVDGQHIKGLLYLLFDKHYTSLIQNEFIFSLETPLVKANKGKKNVYFYNSFAFDEWSKENKGYKVKYFKGIGSLPDEELDYVFKNPKLLTLDYDKDASLSLSLAFDKGKENERKIWINSYIPSEKESKTITDFVNNDLITHSVENVNRTITNIIDGLKQSQRKILYTCILKCKTKEYKVSNLQGLVSSTTNYHYGNKCLEDAIFNMGKNYIGSNNIPLLAGEGNFGSRMGHDNAQARYPSVKLSPIVKFIFREEDNIILEYEKDGDTYLEPKYYYPIIPIWLVNGCNGVATGYNHYVSPRNPKKIIKYIEHWIKDKKLFELEPYYHNYKGKIFKNNEKWYSKYKIRFEENIYHIKEIPITITGSKVMEKLDKYVEDGKIKSYKDLSYGFKTERCKDTQPYFIVECDEIPFEKKVVIKKDNVNLLDKKKRCIQYKNIYEALDKYCSTRLHAYKHRKEKLLEQYKNQLNLEKLKARYISDVIDGNLVITKKDDEKLRSEMEEKGYPDEFLSLQHRSLTQSKIDEHLRTVQIFKKKIKELEDIIPKNIWLNELKELKKHL